MKEIPLTKGKVAYVDDCDYDLVSRYKWYYGKNGYAYTNGGRLSMHRLIMGNPKGKIVDHRDRNKLMNTRENLRVTTQTFNTFNRKGNNSNVTSSYKGVYWKKDKSKWEATIKCNGKKHFIGYFNDDKEAGKAYDRKAKELFGEYAYINFPEAQ